VHKFPYFHWSFYRQENINITTVEYIMRYLYFQSTRQIRKYYKKKSRKSGEELCPFKDFSFIYNKLFIDIVDWIELHKIQKRTIFLLTHFSFFPHFIPTLSFFKCIFHQNLCSFLTFTIQMLNF